MSRGCALLESVCRAAVSCAMERAGPHKLAGMHKEICSYPGLALSSFVPLAIAIMHDAAVTFCLYRRRLHLQTLLVALGIFTRICPHNVPGTRHHPAGSR